jgi:hypothetical protein
LCGRGVAVLPASCPTHRFANPKLLVATAHYLDGLVYVLWPQGWHCRGYRPMVGHGASNPNTSVRLRLPPHPFGPAEPSGCGDWGLPVKLTQRVKRLREPVFPRALLRSLVPGSAGRAGSFVRSVGRARHGLAVQAHVARFGPRSLTPGPTRSCLRRQSTGCHVMSTLTLERSICGSSTISAPVCWRLFIEMRLRPKPAAIVYGETI